MQSKQLSKAVNSARTLRSIGQQASLYTRLTTRPNTLPPYVELFSASDWTTSALLCSAFESITLPTRLTAAGGRQSSLAQFEDLLSKGGQRRIAELSFQSSPGTATRTMGVPQSDVSRHSDGNDEVSGRNLDIQLSPYPAESRRGKSSHVFAQAVLSRGPSFPTLGAAAAHDPEEQYRRHVSDESTVEIYTSGKPFPLMDTFPEHLINAPQEHGRELELQAALTTTSRIAETILALRNLTVRGLPLEEREDLYSDLTTMAENYAHDWDEGSDEGEDD